jgi:hypothetical protein
MLDDLTTTKLNRFYQTDWANPGKSNGKGRLNTVGLLVLASFDQLLFVLKILVTFFYKTTYLNEEVNCTEPVSIPWLITSVYLLLVNFNKTFFFIIFVDHSTPQSLPIDWGTFGYSTHRLAPSFFSNIRQG